MKTQSPDTAESAERVLIELQRRKSASEKIDQVRSLSGVVMRLSRRAIVRARKPRNQSEADLLFIELHYGAELAGRLKRYLKTRHHDRS